MLALAIKSRIPLIYIETDDLINVEEVLTFIAEEQVVPVKLPEVIDKIGDLKIPQFNVLYTSSKCASLVKLYHFCVENEKTIIFVNTERSVLQFDGGQLVAPKELVLQYLKSINEDDAPTLLPAFGGLTLKDVGEVAKMTMTRDESLTVRGVNTTRRGYRNLKGIIQVDTNIGFYMQPSYLTDWLNTNAEFFMNPIDESLVPRGLLFGGPPGTGKTLAAKVIAARFGIPLYRLDVGAMKGKYVGDSEGNLMAALAQIDQVEPCVVILDEIEKAFQSQSDSGVTSSMLSQLLWWLQEHQTRVFTVMTTNDKDKIPKELYREGRIDKTMEFMGVEGAKDGEVFITKAFEAKMQDVGKEPTPAHYAKLKATAKTLYSGEAAVPQVKLTQAAYSLVRQLFSGEEQ